MSNKKIDSKEVKQSLTDSIANLSLNKREKFESEASEGSQSEEIDV